MAWGRAEIRQQAELATQSDSPKGAWFPGLDGRNDIYVHLSSIPRDGYEGSNEGDLGRISTEAARQSTLNHGFPQVDASVIKTGSAAKAKILVADDEQVIANTLALILSMSGFDARAVHNCRAAVDALSSFEPDILVSDVMMPEMTGIEAAIAILEQWPSCKVLLFSGQAATVDLLIAARAQGHNFEILTKPIHPSDLLRQLRSDAFALQSCGLALGSLSQ